MDIHFEIYFFMFYQETWRHDDSSNIRTDKIHEKVTESQARNQDFVWGVEGGGANEAKVDQTTEMYFLSNSF